MKHTNLTISIPSPCGEDWEAMSAKGQGRHCAACQRTVIDFTLMTDGQILDVYKQAKDVMPCGRFLDTQLDRELVDTRYKPSFIAVTAKRVAAALILLQTSVTAVQAQQKEKDGVTENGHRKHRKKKHQPEAHGRLFEPRSGDPIINARVSIKNSSSSCVTDSNGRFWLVLPDVITDSAITIEYTDRPSGAPLQEIVPLMDIINGKEIQLTITEVDVVREIAPKHLKAIPAFMGIPPRPMRDIVVDKPKNQGHPPVKKKKQ